MNYKWFPIGWSVFAHDVGDGNDPYEQDWENGTVEYLHSEQEMYWINCLYLEPLNNYEAWGLPVQRWRSDQWTTTATYERMLDALETKRIQTSGVYDFKALAAISTIAIPTPTQYQMNSPGTWRDFPEDNGVSSDIPASNLEIFEHRINYLEDKPQLVGWILANEPYGGKGAEDAGRRDAVHTDLLFLRGTMESEDDNSADHPIHATLRSYGNYFNVDANKNPIAPPSSWLDDLNVADVVHDDLYNVDYFSPNNVGLIEAVRRTQAAMTYLLDPAPGMPTYDDDIHAWLLHSQGMYMACANPQYEEEYGYLHEEQLRYVNYAAWINGAQGAMFWLLSKSNTTAFPRAKKISYEAHLVSEYLMEPDAGIAATITSTEGDETVQFILRRHPDYQDQVLIMICNNTDEEADIWVYFPQSCEIQQVEQLVQSYQWSCIVYSDRINIGMGPWKARAFILHVDED
ncbi:MAG TPA: hypothetical protein PLY86_06770 [bacterium]|nr:hypothetical protein [bacterium]